MQHCLFWSSSLRIAWWKEGISAFFSPPPNPHLLWKFVLTRFSHFLFCKDVTLLCTRRLFCHRGTKRHRNIKPVNGAVSLHPQEKSIKVFSSHFALAVSHLTTFCMQKKKKRGQKERTPQNKQTKKALFFCLVFSVHVEIWCLEWPRCWNLHFCHPQLLTRLPNNNSLKVFTVAVSSIIRRATHQVASNSLQGKSVR